MNSRDLIQKKALEYVRANDMLKTGDKVVAGISGGADSMCLLGLLLDWREQFDLGITVLHVNHGIRGAEADEDECFVRDFCSERDVAFRAVHADIPAMAAESGCTEEEEGRNFRYRVFEETARELGCSRIAVAHNRSDNAETVLFNILRGSGISGLRGITPVRHIISGRDDTAGGDTAVTIIRPLLSTSRQDIEEYLRSRGIGYRTDKTNFDTGYSRNAIRNIVMPLFREQINARAEEHIVRLAGQAAMLEQTLQRMTESGIAFMKKEGSIRIDTEGNKKTITLETAGLKNEDELMTGIMIRSLIGEAAGRLKDITGVHIDNAVKVLKGKTGKRISLPYGIVVRKEYGRLIIERTCGCGGEERKVSENRENEPDTSGTILNIIDTDTLAKYTERSPISVNKGDCRLTMYVTERENKSYFTKNLYSICFDYDKIKNGISIRFRQSGDHLLIKNSGRLVRKSLKTWMIDNKIPAGRRDRVMLLTEGNHVLWVIGYRRDDSCPVDDKTRRVLVVTVSR